MLTDVLSHPLSPCVSIFAAIPWSPLQHFSTPDRLSGSDLIGSDPGVRPVDGFALPQCTFWLPVASLFTTLGCWEIPIWANHFHPQFLLEECIPFSVWVIITRPWDRLAHLHLCGSITDAPLAEKLPDNSLAHSSAFCQNFPRTSNLTQVMPCFCL